MEKARQIIRTYLVLQFGNTLAASLIWGINTLFLLNAGLSIFEAFLANAFYTLGMVIFEIPTGIVADSWGRRTSYLLGTVTLSASTILYFVLWQAHSPFWLWAVASMLLGLGYTFFSGAVEAWLIDALHHVRYKGKIEAVFGKAQIVGGAAMLIGTLGGGLIAQFTNLGVPYLVRGGILLLLFLVAWLTLRDIGFVPERGEKVLKAMRTLLKSSIDNGLKVLPVRWLMLSAVILSSVGFYAFYALQPYLLELFGDTTAYWVAGLAATLVALAQISGGLLAGRIAGLFARRTTALVLMTVVSSAVLVLLYFCHNFYLALALIFVWGILFAATMPIRQTYMNGMIPSKQRATVLSFDSVMSNLGGMVLQPGLAKVADMYSYGTSFFVGGVLQLFALPMLARSRSYKHDADKT
jgi:MFS family permease